MTKRNEERNWTKVEQEGILYSETGNLQAMLSKSRHVLTGESFTVEVSALVMRVTHAALNECFEVLVHVSVGENTWNKDFK